MDDIYFPGVQHIHGWAPPVLSAVPRVQRAAHQPEAAVSRLQLPQAARQEAVPAVGAAARPEEERLGAVS